VMGAFAAGVLMKRLELFRALLYFGIAQAFSNLLFLLLAIVGKNYGVLVLSVFVDNFCVGLGTTALVALLMSLCDKRYSATQYALLSSLSATTRVFIGPIAGVMIQHFGWVELYFWSFVVALPGLFILVWLRNRTDFIASVQH